MAPESRATSALPPGDVDTGEAPPNLAGTVIGGVAWKLSSRAVSGVTHLVVIVVLARLLTPTDYGIAGMALLVTSFAFIFTDPALGAALVQRPTIDERDRSTVFWLATAIGTVLTILGVLLSGLVADFFDQEQVRDLVIVSSLCLGLTSLSVVHRALLTRRLAYRALEVRDMVATVAGAAVSIGVAAAGFGPWAIIANLLVYVLVGTILVWAFLDWRPRAIFSVSSARKLGGFSAKITSAAVFDWGNQNLDTALVGRYLGAASLGAYSLAYNAMRLPVNYLGRPLFQALSPAYSRIQEDRTRLERVWLRTKRVSIAIIAPALLVLIVVAPDFVPVVLGDQWGDAVVPLQILCIGGLAEHAHVAALGRTPGVRRSRRASPGDGSLGGSDLDRLRGWPALGHRGRRMFLRRGKVAACGAVDLADDARRSISFLADAAGGKRDSSRCTRRRHCRLSDAPAASRVRGSRVRPTRAGLRGDASCLRCDDHGRRARAGTRCQGRPPAPWQRACADRSNGLTPAPCRR